MIENIRNLIRDHWQARHTDIVGLKEELREIKQHLADQRARCDRLAERMNRIEKQLSEDTTAK